MNPPQNRGYPVPWVRHSVPSNQLPQQGQPPIVMDVQRLIEHMRADFRSELQTFKVELLAAMGAQLQAMPAQTPALMAPDPDRLYQTIKRVMGEIELPKALGAPRPDRAEEAAPLFVPSGLLAPREGTVAVHTSDEGAGNLEDAAKVLRKMKGSKK